MDAKELKQRTKKFGLDVIKLVESLPSTQTGKVIGNQLLRSPCRSGQTTASACRGRSKADFISKVGITSKKPTSPSTVGDAGRRRSHLI